MPLGWLPTAIKAVGAIGNIAGTIGNLYSTFKGLNQQQQQFRRYMYLPSEKRQYYLGVTGGAQDFSWSSSIGYDDNTGNLGEKYNRTNLRFQNIWKPLKKLQITSGIYYTETNTKSGRTAYGGVIMARNSFVPYMQLADEQGNPLVVNSLYDQNYKDSFGSGKLLDWNYYPLTDWQYNQVKTVLFRCHRWRPRLFLEFFTRI